MLKNTLFTKKFKLFFLAVLAYAVIVACSTASPVATPDANSPEASITLSNLSSNSQLMNDTRNGSAPEYTAGD